MMKIFMFRLAGLFVVALSPLIANSRTLRVPADCPSIQYAINVSTNGDTVLVSPGIYNEAVNFAGKGISLISVGGPSVTMIEPPAVLYNWSPAIQFDQGETSNSLVSGFTLTNAGIGIDIAAASPVIRSNVIINCQEGIFVASGSPMVANNCIIYCLNDNGVYLTGICNAVIQSNLIQSNRYNGIALGGGNGIIQIADNLIQGNQGSGIAGYVYGPNYGVLNDFRANIIQNLIADNSENGLLFELSADGPGAVVVNNTVVNNDAGGVGLSYNFGPLEFVNNIFYDTAAPNIVEYYYSASLFFANNDLYSVNGTVSGGIPDNPVGTNGNISANPYLACLPGGDYHLLPGSPCVDAGTNNAPYLPGTDFDGNPRIRASVDMGAFEFNPASPATPCIFLDVATNMVVLADPGQDSVAVSFPAMDATPGATVTCAPPSGSVFPEGTNTVVCTLVYGTNVLTGAFTVTVQVPPRATTVPSTVSVVAGSNATLAVSAYSSLPIDYQWNFKGNAVGGATNSVLVISNAQAANEGYYQVGLTNNLGGSSSQPIFLRVLPVAPQFTSEPASLTVPAGGTAVISGPVTGSQPLSLQWYLNSTPLYGFTQSPLVISNVQASDAGIYQLVASNYLGIIVSTGAVLTVTPTQPWFIVQPVSTGVNWGATAEFTCLAAGSNDATNMMSYTWFFQDRPISWQTSGTLWVGPATNANQGEYFVVASNAYGQATSEVAELSVYLPPTLSAGLTNIVATEGNTVTFAASFDGTAPLSYSWSFNYLTLTNQGSVLTLSNVTPAQSGTYAVTVSNSYGIASSTGRLSVHLPASQVFEWGDDSAGQTDVPTNSSDVVAVAGGEYFSLALHSNGTITSWGDDEISAPTNSLPYVAMAAGAGHALGVFADGTMTAWGRNDFGQANVPYGTVNVASVAAGDFHSLALLSFGAVIAWGDNTYGQLNLPQLLQPQQYWTNISGNYYWVTIYSNPVQAIAARGYHNLALLANGTVVAWGDNSFGQSSAPTNLVNATAIAAGYLHSVALCADGTVTAWGDDTYGQTNVPTGLSNVVAIAAGDFHTLALQSNGRVVSWGDNSFGQTTPPANLPRVAAIACGSYHNLALAPVTPLSGHLSSGQMVLNWGAGILQWAPTLAGPYADLPSQGGSFTNLDLPSVPEKYFRVRY